MKETLALSLAINLALFSGGAVKQQTSHPGEPYLVHFVVINMSGSPRALHHGADVIPLPVATRVPVQIPAGDRVEVKSDANTGVDTTFTVQRTEEGHVLPIR